MRTIEEKHKRRTREKRIQIWTLKGEKVMEFRDKVEEEYPGEMMTMVDHGRPWSPRYLMVDHGSSWSTVKYCGDDHGRP